MTTSKSKALQTQTAPPPAFVDAKSREGVNFKSEDLQVPMLLIAQDSSPQVKKHNPRYIEGLEYGDLFNSVSKFIYGSEPLKVSIICAYNPRWMEMKDQKEGGGIKDANVPPGDPRREWNGNTPPVATKYYSYVLYIHDHHQLVLFSMKRSSARSATNLNTLITERVGPIFAGRYKLSVEKEVRGGNDIAVPHFDNDGWVEDEELYKQLEDFYHSMKDRQREVVDENANMAAAEQSETAQGQDANEEVPF